MTHADNHGDTTEQTEKRYYYHADHLQSAQFITDANGEKYEQIEYTPYGELWIEETAPGVDKLPFRFTGKELDTETGLYYYGARYLDPKYSRWLSGDPALGEYIPQAGADTSKLPNGGVYNSFNFAVFEYANNNPVKYNDPDGRVAVVDDATAVVVAAGLLLTAGVISIANNRSYKDTVSDLASQAGELGKNIIDGTIEAGKWIGEKIGGLFSKGDKAKPKTKDKTEEKKDENNSNAKLRGEPGEIKRSGKNGQNETKIGEDGRAVRERHHSDHGTPNIHSKPHDHDIRWNENGKPEYSKPINYRDGDIPEL